MEYNIKLGIDSTQFQSDWINSYSSIIILQPTDTSRTPGQILSYPSRMLNDASSRI